MQDLMQKLTGNLIDLLIYGAIAAVCLTGFIKCTIVCRSCARALRRAVHRLEMMTLKDGSQPVWQDPLFLGKRMRTAWKRFLVNAEQLDSRGMNCNVEDYINDDTVIYEHCHTQLGEVIPGILTSLGILGTFIGLVRGLGALNLSDAASTMAGMRYLSAVSKAWEIKSTISWTVEGANTRIWKSPWPVALVACQ